MKIVPCISILIFLATSTGFSPFASAQQRSDIIIADFEGKDYGDWKTTGEAFGTGPAQGTLPGQMAVTGYRGHGLVNSFYHGDSTTGTLTSPIFTISRRYMNFLIGGGKAEGVLCLNLVVDGKIVHTATGPNDKQGGSERLEWKTWDLRGLEGKKAHIEIIDNATGGWGHINVDEITLSDGREEEEIKSETLYKETYRPQFHFTSQTNWLNDPNGLVYYKGEYHLFFQHNPEGINWGNMTWGHAVSADLIHWHQLPDALKPDELGTMFSGSAVVDWNNTTGFQTKTGKSSEKPLVAIYTAAGGTSDASKGKSFTQCIAYSLDKGRTWTKYAQNPVLPHIAGENRDPKVVWHEPTKRWIMALYLDKEDFGFYSSPDLKSWTLLHKITVPGCSECPDFFEIPVSGEPRATKWVWTAANGKYLVGDFDGKKFTPDGPVQSGTDPYGQVDFGANYYAVQTYSDIPTSDGRRIQIAWMTGGSYPQMPFNQQMSFPCELTLHRTSAGLRLYRYPVTEIHASANHMGVKVLINLAMHPGENPLNGLVGELWDIEAEIEIGNAKEIGFMVRGEKVRYDVKSQMLSCLNRDAPLKSEGGRIKIRILVDRTTLEVFGNEGQVSLTSCFLARQKEQSISIYSIGGDAHIVSMRASKLRSALTAH